MADEVQQVLDELASQVRICRQCPLCESRTNAVPGEGSYAANLMFVGEAPGADEDQQGRPFVGRSGQLLRQTIRDIGLSEEEVFIGNVLKCRPPGNRDPQPSEIDSCKQYLFAQISLIRPKVIVTLGRHSMGLLIKDGLKITQVHGQHIKKDGQLYLPTFHPSYILRNRNALPDFQRDLLKAKKLSEMPG